MIHCSRKDYLTFKICEEEQALETQRIRAIAEFSATSFIELNKNKIGME